MEHIIERVKQEHRRIYDFHNEYYKSIEKTFLPLVKEASHLIDKNIKKSKEYFLKNCYQTVK